MNVWSNDEEKAIAQIIAERKCSRAEAIRTMRRAGAGSGVAEFRNQFEQEHADLRRIRDIIHRYEPKWSRAAEQALTNFMLGLPTGNFRFVVIAGSLPEPCAVYRPGRRTGRPKLRLTAKERKQRRRIQWRGSQARKRNSRAAECQQKVPCDSQKTDGLQEHFFDSGPMALSLEPDAPIAA